jgi:hypothetical protein
MVNSTKDGARNVGFSWVRPGLRAAPCGHDNQRADDDACGPFAYQRGGSEVGWENPCGIKYVWAPVIHSISGTMRDADGAISSAPTDVMLASFVAYSVWDTARDTASAADFATLTGTNLQQPLGGFRSLQAGGREMYATNAGHVFRTPREVLSASQCSEKYHRVWALVLSHSAAATNVGAWIVDSSWQLEEL